MYATQIYNKRINLQNIQATLNAPFTAAAHESNSKPA